MKEVRTSYDLSEEQLNEVNGGSFQSLMERGLVAALGFQIAGPAGAAFALGAFNGFSDV